MLTPGGRPVLDHGDRGNVNENVKKMSNSTPLSYRRFSGRHRVLCNRSTVVRCSALAERYKCPQLERNHHVLPLAEVSSGCDRYKAMEINLKNDIPFVAVDERAWLRFYSADSH